MPEDAVPEPEVVKPEGCCDRALWSPFAPAPVLFPSGTGAQMPLMLFLLFVSGGNVAELCGLKALFAVLERAAGSLPHHAVSYRPHLLVTDLPGRKAADQPESRPKGPAAGQAHRCGARVETKYYAAC